MENTKKRAQTVKKIKDALMQLFQQMDYQKISVTMLCKQAGLHRSTFYLYYNSIDEVLREIEHDILNEIQLYADQMNDFRDAKTPEEMKKIYQDNEQRMLEFYKWQYSIRDYLNPLLGAYGDPYFIRHYEKIIYDNTLPALDFIKYDYKKHPYVMKYITGGILKTNQEWLQNGDISIDELVKLQRDIVFNIPLLHS